MIQVTPNDKFRLFRWNDDNREASRTITVGESETTYSASFISADLIPGLFSVSSGKQVFFSKGNLYWDGSKYCFEANQYTTPSDSNEPGSHVAHFYWSSKADVARPLETYSDTDASRQDTFFANHPESFEVNGQTGLSILTGGDNGERKYLLNSTELRVPKTMVLITHADYQLFT